MSAGRKVRGRAEVVAPVEAGAGQWCRPGSVTEVVSTAPTVDNNQQSESRFDDLLRYELRQNIKLKGTYAWTALVCLAVQLPLADIVFGLYCHALSWNVPSSAMECWLGATVVQVIGVVLVVVRCLFPSRSYARRARRR